MRNYQQKPTDGGLPNKMPLAVGKPAASNWRQLSTENVRSCVIVEGKCLHKNCIHMHTHSLCALVGGERAPVERRLSSEHRSIEKTAVTVRSLILPNSRIVVPSSVRQIYVVFTRYWPILLFEKNMDNKLGYNIYMKI